MKKLIAIFAIAAGLFLTACGPHTYSTLSSGKDDVSFIIVLSDNGLNEVKVHIDDQQFTVDKIYKLKATRKAHPIVTTPGRHKVVVTTKSGEVLFEDNVFLSAQETRKIIL